MINKMDIWILKKLINTSPDNTSVLFTFTPLLSVLILEKYNTVISNSNYLVMFLITISFRHEEKDLFEIEKLEVIADGVIEGMKKCQPGYYKRIEKFIKPMNQLEAGLHISLSNLSLDYDLLKNLFCEGKETGKYKVVRARFIAKNFVKLDFICDDCLPFRVNSDTSQELQLFKAYRTVI